MIQFVSGNFEQATELMLILPKYFSNTFKYIVQIQIRQFGIFQIPIQIQIFEYKYKYVFGPSPGQHPS